MFSGVCTEPFKKWGAVCVRRETFECTTISMVSCGPLACAKSRSNCAKEIIKMVAKTAAGAAEFALFVTTFGMGGAAAKAGEEVGKKVAEKFAEEYTNKALFAAGEVAFMSDLDDFFKFLKGVTTFNREKKEKGEAYINVMVKKAKEKLGSEDTVNITTACRAAAEAIVKKTPRTESAIRTMLSGLKKVDPTGISEAVLSCGSAHKEAAECARSIVEVASRFDITGILGIAAAFIYPMCTDLSTRRRKRHHKRRLNKH